MKSFQINGANVTVPFKKEIIPFLDKLTLEAKATQSVNTIYLREKKLLVTILTLKGSNLH